MEDIQTDVKFRIMPSGDGGWYWEVIADARSAISRGLAIARVQHSQEASEAAKAKLIQQAAPGENELLS
jgi:hypothetical protein